jgi:hypothetical protein
MFFDTSKDRKQLPSVLFVQSQQIKTCVPKELDESNPIQESLKNLRTSSKVQNLDGALDMRGIIWNKLRTFSKHLRYFCCSQGANNVYHKGQTDFFHQANNILQFKTKILVKKQT